MDFTPQERKMVDRLRKQQRDWPWARWVQFISGLVLGVGAIWLHLKVQPMIRFNPIDANSLEEFDRMIFVVMMGFLGPLILLVKGCIYIGIALRDWHGNVRDTLLLKLIEPQERADNTGDKS